ncbi:aminotransferase class V-fold PLP-dependent enzyme [Tateyamaria sp. ANG-S1]|uniref:cysteine desulfurase family protein n=1 Tax=Tateyamaria sp. ANG-S1 TaxID=1577905 RepID=UPI000580895C|nr:aminotransferase class V-fold PLP-dependent enzyme [Tateyamaria sp. ANG-S1]KIC48763.1 aminotransferase [Tateyamaria sp. ANG-S1]
MDRVYLDHNATTPLRPAAREAMLRAMDVVGNPSSVHAEGRAAKAIVEKARGQISEALGASGADIVFTASATEAAALACAGRSLHGAAVEHDAVGAWVDPVLGADAQGLVAIETPGASTLQYANSETGVVQDVPRGLALSDLTQCFGKLPFGFGWLGIEMGLISAHKLGGPKGVGALILRQGLDVQAQVRGGGQEMGRRSGTENVIGIAGFGAAAEAAQRDIADGKWDRVEKLRNILENALAAASKTTIFVGKGARRLPNTSCFITPGWKGETQVMQMDLAGFAISAGSACSSGKVRASRVLSAMGYSELEASSAVRVSLGLETTEEDVMRFAEVWAQKLKKHGCRAA